MDRNTLQESHKTFKIITLGCRTNQYESQAYKNQLEYAGYRAANSNEIASLCIVNTCTVTHSADSSSRLKIRQLAKQNPNAQIIVTGCMADSAPAAIKEIEGVSHVIPNAKKETLLPDLFPEEEFPEFSIKNYDDRTRAFIKIQDGCNSFCTYCIIPYVRGRSRSKTISEIIREVETVIESGYKEIVLTGINIGDFDGGNKQASLAELVTLLDQLPGLERIRISSIDPDEVDDALLIAVIEGKKTCHSMHIVLQSGSNIVLKRMNRKYSRQMFFDTIDRLKQASNRFTFTTDIIVGFPGETEKDFQETLDVVKEVRFAKVHMFPYSKRERTRAALYKDSIPEEIIHFRKQKLLRISEKIAFDLRQSYVGQEVEILTEGKTDGLYKGIYGHTDNFLKVILPDQELPSNQLIRVSLEENTPEGLLGSLV